MRLIDADKFKQQIATITVADNLSAEKCNALCRLIDKQPTIGDGDITLEMVRAACNVLRETCSNQPNCRDCILYSRYRGCILENKMPVDWPQTWKF